MSLRAIQVVLHDNCAVEAELADVDLALRHAVDLNGAIGRGVETEHQAYQSAFPRATRPDKGDVFAPL